MSTEDFLDRVITTDEGYLCILIGPPQGNMFEKFFLWPSEKDKAIAYALEQSNNGRNAYFSAHLFSEQSSMKASVLPTRTIQADLDDAAISKLPIAPTVLVRTSPNRHQGYWILNEELETKELESLSRKLTYSIENCDPSGWPLGKRVRLPGTNNYKYTTPHLVEVIEENNEYRAGDVYSVVEDIPTVDVQILEDSEGWVDFIEKNPPTFDESPHDLLMKFRDKVSAGVILYYTRPVDSTGKFTRSHAMFSLITSLFEAGASREQVYYIAKESVNNGFADRKYDADRALAKDVLRGELKSNRRDDDVRTKIKAARRAPGGQTERREAVARVVVSDMLQHGSLFTYEMDGRAWLLPKSGARPISLSKRSEELLRLMDIRYGLNDVEAESKFVVNFVISYAQEYGRKVMLGSLSHYDSDTNTLLIHNGRKSVYEITAETIDTIPNGENRILFLWNYYTDPFYPVGQPLEDWTETVFSSYFHNLSNMTHREAVVLVRVWVMYMLFRSATQNRPILALFGQPGSGKSTLFRGLYSIIYGKSKSVESVTNPDNFDYAVSRDPLVVLDNVDTAVGWLPDKLALSSANSDMTKRKLYTDDDVWVLKRQAMIGITAHNPRFGREDVVDRMLLMFFNRINDWIDESILIDNLLASRDVIWNSIIHDAQRVLQTEKPTHDDEAIPKFRITDFAYYGLWISRALGIESEFLGAIESTKQNQSSFILSEEEILIEAIIKWMDKRPPNEVGEYYTAQQLYDKLNSRSMDNSFQKFYGDGKLARKLWAAHESLKTQFEIDVKHVNGGRKLWRLDKKSETE